MKKKILLTLLLFCLFLPISYGKKHINSPKIEDELLKIESFAMVQPTYLLDKTPIEDDMIKKISTKDNVIKLWATSLDRKQEDLIEDELVAQKIDKSKFTKRHLFLSKAKNKYDFSQRLLPIKMKISKRVTRKHNLKEGNDIEFQTVEDIRINGRTFPKGTTIIGRIENLSKSDKMGTPEEIVIDNFYIEGKENNINLSGKVSKIGANRSIWVYPLYQAGNICFYVAGFIFVPIHGGHIKIPENDVFTIYYDKSLN